MLTDGKNGHN